MGASKNILKSNWERKADNIAFSRAEIETLIKRYSSKQISTLSNFSAGCANSNFYVEFADGEKVVLRIYLRDSAALSKELLFYDLVHAHIPVPKPLFVDKEGRHFKHPFVIQEFVEGANMREVILAGDMDEIYQCAKEAGIICAELKTISMPEAGFFNDEGIIEPFTDGNNAASYIQEIMQDQFVRDSLGVELCIKLEAFIENNKELFFSFMTPTIIHADFDPSNMMVHKENGTYKFAALLDSEFCYSGNFLFDVGQFLRYADRIDPIYQKGFIAGFESSGEKLPENWHLKSKCFDLLNIISIVKANKSENRPQTIADIKSLMDGVIS